MMCTVNIVKYHNRTPFLMISKIASDDESIGRTLFKASSPSRYVLMWSAYAFFSDWLIWCNKVVVASLRKSEAFFSGLVFAFPPFCRSTYICEDKQTNTLQKAHNKRWCDHAINNTCRNSSKLRPVCRLELCFLTIPEISSFASGCWNKLSLFRPDSSSVTVTRPSVFFNRSNCKHKDVSSQKEHSNKVV